MVYEPTGRYGAVGKCGGGVNVASGTIEVDALRASDVIADILEAHDWIDLMKIDIEGLERNVLLSIPRWQLERIDRIYAEVRLDSNPLSDTHDMHQYGEIAQFPKQKSPPRCLKGENGSGRLPGGACSSRFKHPMCRSQRATMCNATE